MYTLSARPLKSPNSPSWLTPLAPSTPLPLPSACHSTSVAASTSSPPGFLRPNSTFSEGNRSCLQPTPSQHHSAFSVPSPRQSSKLQTHHSCPPQAAPSPQAYQSRSAVNASPPPPKTRLPLLGRTSSQLVLATRRMSVHILINMDR